jgi:PAS domain S-box-containing protein
MRDVVALSTLPAVWAGMPPAKIADSLSTVLLNTLSLDLIFIQFAGHDDQPPVSVLRTRGCADPLGGDELEYARKVVLHSVRSALTATIKHPLGTSDIRVAATRFGVSDDHGLLVAGSSRPDFPTESERLLLGVGANQTAVVLQRSRAERDVRRSEEELSDFFENASVGMHLVGPNGLILRANKAELDMLGYSRDEYIGRPIAHFHADDAAIEDILRRLHAGENLDQYPARLRCKDGTIKEVLIDSSVRWQNGRFVHTRCFTRDVTERNRAESAARTSEQRFRELADAMPHIVWTAGRDGNIDYLNRRWTDFTGLPATSSNDAWARLLHPADAPEARRRWTESLATGESFETELRLFDRQKGTYLWHLIRTVPVRDASGAVERWFGTGTDIDDQKRAQTTSAYLAEASAALAAVVDYESTLKKVATLAVPYFADWAAVDVVERGQLRRLAVAHLDPKKVETAHELMRRYPDDLASGRGIAEVLRTGVAQMGNGLTDEQLRLGAQDDGHFQLLQSLGLKSYICVPLRASGAVFGALTFATAESGREYTASDLELANDLAHRASVAVENTRLYEALRDGDRRKDEFLATLAHELRNPLAPISNGLQILAMPNVGADTVERARVVMARQVDHMVRLVDDLLDVSRVMRGRIELRRETVELATIVARAVEIAQPLIEAQRHVLDIAVADESLLVYVDPVRLTQVLSNLVANAAKYTPPNGRIRVTAERDGQCAVLRVQDNGIGIAPNMQTQIFELFVQVDHDGIRSQGGLGIGLTLVKNLVEMHDGTVEARSEGAGRGSEFIVRIPISPAARRGTAARTSETVVPRSPSGSKVLVVDDNEDAAGSLATLLRLQGHDVRAAFSGREALEVVKNYVPDVALLDLGMPGMDGFELSGRLRQQPGCERVMLVALTGWGQVEDRRRTAAAGFDHHLVKPPDSRTLERLLTRNPTSN